MTSIASRNERKNTRKRAQTPCQAVAEEGFRLLGSELLDLSPKGALIAAEANARLGEVVLLSLRVPGTRTWVDAEGVVARVVRGKRDTDRGPALGIELLRMDATDRALLAGALERLPPPAPARVTRKDYAATVRSIGDLKAPS